MVGDGGMSVSRRTGANASIELSLLSRSIEGLTRWEFCRERDEEVDIFRSSEARAE